MRSSLRPGDAPVMRGNMPVVRAAVCRTTKKTPDPFSSLFLSAESRRDPRAGYPAMSQTLVAKCPTTLSSSASCGLGSASSAIGLGALNT